MSEKSWRDSLRTRIAPRKSSSPKTALVGIGSELRGDDAAGLEVGRGLAGNDDLLVIEAGPAPENHSYRLRRFQPDRVILIDAVQMDLAPGAIRLIDLNAIDGFSASTHTTPLTLFAHYLANELGCEILLIGIQPGDLTLGAPLTPEVKAAVRKLRRALQADFVSSLQPDVKS